MEVYVDGDCFLCSLGGESLCVAQNTYAVSWFKGRELNAVFGLQLSFSRAVCTVFTYYFHYTSRFHYTSCSAGETLVNDQH